jgi:hypothetical protein
MVDYYLMLSRAAAGIPPSMPGARQALYERARKILAANLENNPPASEAEVAAEKRALEEAITRIESERSQEAATARPASKLRSLPASENFHKIPPDSGAFLKQSSTTKIAPIRPEPARPTLTELLRRVDDAMKEPTPPLPSSQSAVRERPAPIRRTTSLKTVGAEEKPAANTPPARQTSVPPLLRSTKDGLLPRQERSDTKRTELIRILKNFQLTSPGMEASALISKTGQMIASVMAPDIEEARIAGITATLLNLCGRAAAELARGEICEIVVHADHGYAVMIGAGQDALLLALANESSPLGYIFFGMQETVKAFENLH